MFRCQKYRYNWQRNMQDSLHGQSQPRNTPLMRNSFYNRPSQPQVYDFRGHYQSPQVSRGLMYSSYKRRDDDASSTSSSVNPVAIQTKIESNLRQLERLGGVANNPFYNSAAFTTPPKFAKTYVRNTSYDPINGEDRAYNTPPVMIRSLGTDGADVYYAPHQPRVQSASFYR